MKLRSTSTSLTPILTLLLASLATGCSSQPSSYPELKGGDPSSIPEGEAGLVPGKDGSNLLVHHRNGKFFFEVEATLSPDRFTKLRSAGEDAYSKSIQSFTARLQTAGAIPLTVDRETGYFGFLLPYDQNDLLGAIKRTQLSRDDLYVSPVNYDRASIRAVKDLTASSEGLDLIPGSRSDTRGFSGLERIGAPEFVRIAESAIGGGVKVDGSWVKLGITDTGLTYNHPTFFAANGTTSRIQYMRDFTREGRAYFNPNAKFEVAPAAADSGFDFIVQAQVIGAVKVPAMPSGDKFEDVKDYKLKASYELKNAIAADPTQFRLGFIDESTLQSADDAVDLNANHKLDDRLPVLLRMGKTQAEDVVYVDLSGTGDFSKSKPMRDFNATRDVVEVFAEKIGFDLRADKLPSMDGVNSVDVRSASFVGYDPGNHGTHVAGIAAGRKTISNDPDDTLARGVAPNAQILLNRVCSNNNGCNATSAMIDLANKGGAELINMSLGGLNPFNDGYGVQETVLNRLTSTKNVLFIVSAGNSGPGRQTVGSPSVARLSLSVGASASKGLIERQYQWPGNGGASTDGDDDFMLFFSSRGPTAAGGFKPNLSAPGTELSAVQLNAADGHRGGLDVYWGTSMAAPTAAGAYALLLDAVKKYNARYREKPLPTDAVLLRTVLIETARPFDMSRFDPATGATTRGQYTWIDEGTGLIDLPAAWSKLFELREQTLPTGVADSMGKPVELDYLPLTSMKNPTGASYDGSRAWADDTGAKLPAFGTGLYLDYYATDTLRTVHIGRRLPEKLATATDLAALTRQLLTSGEEFVLKTTYYGSAREWLRVGVLDQLDCASSPTSHLQLLGRGAEIKVKEDGTGEIVGLGASALNVCIDRDAISTQLPPGDHGALISAYRKVGGRIATLPSFTVPVSVTVPHRTLGNSTAYEIEGTVKSFGVSRNHVAIPKGATLVRITLTVPEYKASEGCMGVELMALEGGNTLKPSETRAQLRRANCTDDGRPISELSKRELVLTRTQVTPGIWDLHVFGRYKFPRSKFKLRVDYVVAETSVTEIAGPISALSGSLRYQLKDASVSVSPSVAKSSFTLSRLQNTVVSQVANDKHVVVEGKLGKLRTYPAGTRSVTLKTYGSPGNDLDFQVHECAAADADPLQGGECEVVTESGGPDDKESATFRPREGKFYALDVHGYAIRDEGKFYSDELLTFASEAGAITLQGSSPDFQVDYSFPNSAGSSLLTHPLFTSGQCEVGGDLTLVSAEGVTLGGVPIRITH